MPANTAPPTDDRADTRASSEPSTRLSGTQILASGLAAISTTVLLSFFGVAGTIIGAGLASVLTVVANFLYTRSIEKTHAQLRPVVGQIVRPRPGAGGGNALELAGGADDGATAALDEPLDEAATTPPRNAWLRLIDRHGTVRVLTASAAVVFVAVMGAVVAVELMIGKPLTDAVHGTEGSGTSISRTSGEGAESSLSPAGTGANPDAPADQRAGGSTTEDSREPQDGGETTQPTQEPATEDGTADASVPTEPVEPEGSGQETPGGSTDEGSPGEGSTGEGSTDEGSTGEGSTSGSTGEGSPSGESSGGSGTDAPSSGTSSDQAPGSTTEGGTTG